MRTGISELDPPPPPATDWVTRTECHALLRLTDRELLFCRRRDAMRWGGADPQASPYGKAAAPRWCLLLRLPASYGVYQRPHASQGRRYTARGSDEGWRHHTRATRSALSCRRVGTCAHIIWRGGYVSI